MEPLLPELLVPEWNDNAPLPAAVPALEEPRTTDPLEVAVPTPEVMVTAPPEAALESPATIEIEPPAPELP
jgi:hypothetical protein